MIRRWDKSKFPTGPFTLNKDCWQAQNLVNWYPLGGISAPGYVADLVSNKNLTGSVSPSPIIMPDGSPAGLYNGTTAKLGSGAAPSIYAAPISVSAWISPTATSGNQVILCFGAFSDVSANRFQFDFNINAIRWVAVGLTNGVASTAASLVANKLQHILGVEASSTSRTAYLNGKEGTTDTTSVVPAGTPNHFTVGALAASSTSSLFFSGLIGEICVWSKAMSAFEASYLADPGNRFELYYPLRSRKWFSSFPSSLNTTYINKGDKLSSSGVSTNPQHGLALLDFKNNNNEASITITNPAILSTSKADAYFIGYGSTVDHTPSDHQYAPALIKLSCESFNGSMTIHARSRYKMSGKFLIKYIWSN